MTNDCKPVNLAAHGPFRVDRCGCGSVHLHLGPAMVRLTPEALPQLARLVHLACARIDTDIDNPRISRLPPERN